MGEVPEEHVSPFEFYFYLLNGCLGMVMNSAVLFLAFKYVDTRDKPRQILVMNMTLADLLTCTIYMLTRPYLNRFDEMLCYPYYIVIFTSQLASCVFLLCINLDKFIFIVYPLHYYEMVTRKRVLIVMIGIWMTLFNLGALAYSQLQIVSPCNAVQINPYVYLTIIVIYVLVITSSFVISSIIYYIARNSQRRDATYSNKAFKRLFFVFSSTLWTFCTCLPYRVCFLISAILIPCSRTTDSEESVFCTLTAVFFYMIVVGIVFNALITVVTQRVYRQHVIKLLPFLTTIGKSADSRMVRFRRPSQPLMKSEADKLTGSSGMQ
ncbi:unnamed protein product [Bursaphelenchus okinawaensis]|uniref:G-protein coupled receptors family 1 profile domain-containing protein n=1 Tax=Bursaphelenchus okinawaensis TaxID=465554 RepID=A0A811KHS3_9BILA|nr:unnamed protein product [Bursaphelenchus okinawaensis]CAG9103505.1 unnamed protein product [Bursaphelenchus okinawaensis]